MRAINLWAYLLLVVLLAACSSDDPAAQPEPMPVAACGSTTLRKACQRV